MKNGLTGPAWTVSTREEVLFGLSLIAGLQAYQCGFGWLAYILFAKSVFDFGCVFRAAVFEIKKDAGHE